MKNTVTQKLYYCCLTIVPNQVIDTKGRYRDMCILSTIYNMTLAIYFLYILFSFIYINR